MEPSPAPLRRHRGPWTEAAVAEIYRQPLLALIEQSHACHVEAHPDGQVQLCHLLSVKTGGCPEDCAYCPQSARYDTGVEATPLMDVDTVLAAARRARDAGSTRFCMGAAWRQPKPGAEFDRVLAMVRGVADLGLEVCCTLGMLTGEQARKLAEAGLTAYNHNLDTAPEFYGHIISTRTYEDRLRTIDNVREAGITVCCGGILGLGESEGDRIRLLATLANLTPPPESVPINALVAVEGTPLGEQAPVQAFEFVRAIATARLLMPRTKVRLSAGRLSLSPEAQALCFYAGANSIFVGDKLLTTANPGWDHDHGLLKELGLTAEPPALAPPVVTTDSSKSNAPHATKGSVTALRQVWRAEVEELESRQRRRSLPTVTSTPGATEDYCSNDYLGLSRHAEVRAAVERAIEAGIDLGSSGSRLVSGNHPEIMALEAEFAAWTGAEAALLYSSGYAAAVGVLTTLLRPQDIVFSDAQNHASLIDGLRLSRAERIVVAHNSVEALREAFRRHPASGEQRRFLVIESLYSMDGDLAELEAMAELCRAAGVAMIVDEAHATGIFGERGAGCVRPEMADVVAARLHPCGKALGASGALVTGPAEVRDLLINRSRAFIFSTAPSPLLAAQLRAAVRVAGGDAGLRTEVKQRARELRRDLGAQGIEAGGSEESPVIPVILGSEAAALAAETALSEAGFRVRAIRPPSVAEGTSRLRLTVHAGQTRESGARLAEALARVPGMRVSGTAENPPAETVSIAL